jgi:hypothetical protein
VETIAKMANVPFHGPIPRFDTIRRVPSRYHRFFPLALMKEYQFAVIGAAGNTLTVAIAYQQQRAVIESLNKLTGRTVFPVLVEPARMRLLIERIERCEQRKYYQLRGRPCYLHSAQLQSIMYVLLMMNKF